MFDKRKPYFGYNETVFHLEMNCKGSKTKTVRLLVLMKSEKAIGSILALLSLSRFLKTSD